MSLLLKNALRNAFRHLIQFFGLILIIVLLLMAGMSIFAAILQVNDGYHLILKHSTPFDYRITPDVNDFATTKGQEDVNDCIADKDATGCAALWQDGEIKLTNNDDLKLAFLVNKTLEQQSSLSSYQFSALEYLFITTNLSTDVKKEINLRIEKAFNGNDQTTMLKRTLSNVYITEGSKPATNNQIVINKRFAKNNGLSLGDALPINNDLYEIVGFGYSSNQIRPQFSSGKILSGDSPFMSHDLSDSSLVWMNSSGFKSLLEATGSKDYHIDSLITFAPKTNENFNQFQNNITRKWNFNYLSSSIKNFNDDFHAGSTGQFLLTQLIAFSAIFAVAMLIMVLISSFSIRKEINTQRVVIGVLKSLGYRSRQLAISFITTIMVAVGIAGVLGYCLSLALQLQFNDLTINSVALPISMVSFNPILFVVSIIAVPLFFMIFGYLIAMVNLRQRPLTLIRGKDKAFFAKFSSLTKRVFAPLPFGVRLTTSFATKSIGKLTVMVLAFLFSALLLVFLFLIVDVFQAGVGNSFNIVQPRVTNTLDIDTSQYHFNTSHGWYTQSDDYPEFQWVDHSNVGKILKPVDPGWIPESCATQEQWLQWATLLANDYNGFYFPLQTTQALAKAASACEATGELPTKFKPIFTMLSHLNQELYFGAVAYTPYNTKTKTGSRRLLKWNAQLTKASFSAPIRQLQIFGLDQILVDDFYNLDLTATERKTILNSEIDPAKQTVPVVLGKTTAKFYHYKVGDEFKVNFTLQGKTLSPVTLKIIKIFDNENVTHYAFINQAVMRKILTYPTYNYNKQFAFPTDYYNGLVIADKNLIPMIAFYTPTTFNDSGEQKEADYTFSKFPTWTILSQNILSIDNLKDSISSSMTSISQSLDTIRWVIICAIAVILIILVSIIFDENNAIIITMKVLGYRVMEITRYISTFYLSGILVAYIGGYAISYVLLEFVLNLIFMNTGILLTVPVYGTTIAITFAIVLAIIILAFAFAMFLTQRKSITKFLNARPEG